VTGAPRQADQELARFALRFARSSLRAHSRNPTGVRSIVTPLGAFFSSTSLCARESTVGNGNSPRNLIASEDLIAEPCPQRRHRALQLPTVEVRLRVFQPLTNLFDTDSFSAIRHAFTRHNHPDKSRRAIISFSWSTKRIILCVTIPLLSLY
jgi:hypothetical protein